MALYVYFADALNCPARDINCLQSKTSDEIIDAQMKAEVQVSSLKLLEFFEPWEPWIDGEIIKGQLLEIEKWIGNETFPLKPFMIGTLTEECVIYIYSAWTKPVPVNEYVAVIVAAVKEDALKMLGYYPPQFNSSDQRDVMSVLATRWVFSCSTRKFLETYMSHPRSNDNIYYMSVFDFPLDFDGWGSDQGYCNGHVCHGGDMPYTFDVPDSNFTSSGHTIAVQHIQYWSNYARSESPNSQNNILNWPNYDIKSRNNLRFKAPENIIESEYIKKDCDFLDSIGYYHN